MFIQELILSNTKRQLLFLYLPLSHFLSLSLCSLLSLHHSFASFVLSLIFRAIWCILSPFPSDGTETRRNCSIVRCNNCRIGSSTIMIATMLMHVSIRRITIWFWQARTNGINGTNAGGPNKYFSFASRCAALLDIAERQRTDEYYDMMASSLHHNAQSRMTPHVHHRLHCNRYLTHN